MIFLRCIGVLNAAIWFGSAVFFTFVAGPELSSDEMAKLLGANHTPYFAGAITQLIREREGLLQLICAVVALLHLCGERLYFGRIPGERRAGILAALVVIALMMSLWINPRLGKLHTTRNAVNASPEAREAAGRSYDNWRSFWQAVNVCNLVGLGIYVCRVGRSEK